MSHLGEFSTHTRDGKNVFKQINPRHPAGSGFTAAMTRGGEAGLRCHLEALRSAQVRLPRDLAIMASSPLTIRHRWVVGPTVLEVARGDPKVFATAVRQIATWTRELDGMDARIDTNLANFCLVDDQPVLIDVLPPLMPSLRPEPETLFDELFGGLCFDTPVILDALIGYALRELLRANQPAACELLPIADELDGSSNGTCFPASWFAARRGLAMRAAAGDEDPGVVHDFFARTSVLGFRQLSETGRRLRLDEVERRIQKARLS